jgi:hypothetical protein
MATKKIKNFNLSMFLAIAALIVSVVAIFLAIKPPKPASPSRAVNGNGLPNGAHFNLNVIGVPKGKTADMTGSLGRRIFVPLTGNCKISLSVGNFQILDPNCTDGKAGFQLPNPDVNNTGTSTYSVWARALGTPGGSSRMTTCANDELGEEWCSTEQLVSIRNNGRSTFTDVSKYLLYMYVDLDGNGTPERYNIFNDALMGYFWNYDNNNLKLLQLRFYEVPSTVQ